MSETNGFPPLASVVELMALDDQELAFKLTDVAIVCAFRTDMTPQEVLRMVADSADEDGFEWEPVRSMLEDQFPRDRD